MLDGATLFSFEAESVEAGREIAPKRGMLGVRARGPLEECARLLGLTLLHPPQPELGEHGRVARRELEQAR
ncbi:MAG: hypothetical protein JO341_07500 [Gammaproteobacteria bacterium]|nr:hypothetical protein [Gammaproteobacteria bacterium]